MNCGLRTSAGLAGLGTQTARGCVIQLSAHGIAEVARRGLPPSFGPQDLGVGVRGKKEACKQPHQGLGLAVQKPKWSCTNATVI